MHWINNYYPVKNTINFAKICVLDGDLSDGRILVFQQLGPNLGKAGQLDSHEHSLFIALLSRLSFLELSEREFRPMAS